MRMEYKCQLIAKISLPHRLTPEGKSGSPKLKEVAEVLNL